MLSWYNIVNIEPKDFVCWSCDKKVASDKGYYVHGRLETIYICPNCSVPVYYDKNGVQVHYAPFGDRVGNLPDNVGDAYQEARLAHSVSSYTASAMMCRKILMNVAVEKGAEKNKNFVYYVGWLFDQHYVPPNAKDWVDHIRKKGNEATHEIPSISKEDSEGLLMFCEALLKNIYELPGKFTVINGDDE